MSTRSASGRKFVDMFMFNVPKCMACNTLQYSKKIYIAFYYLQLFNALK